MLVKMKEANNGTETLRFAAYFINGVLDKQLLRQAHLVLQNMAKTGEGSSCVAK